MSQSASPIVALRTVKGLPVDQSIVALRSAKGFLADQSIVALRSAKGFSKESPPQCQTTS